MNTFLADMMDSVFSKRNNNRQKEDFKANYGEDKSPRDLSPTEQEAYMVGLRSGQSRGVFNAGTGTAAFFTVLVVGGMALFNSNRQEVSKVKPATEKTCHAKYFNPAVVSQCIVR